MSQYASDQIGKYEKDASRIDRSQSPHDDRLSSALYFINGLTTRQLSTLELGLLNQLSGLTKVMVVIGKADCLLPHELTLLKARVAEQLKETEIDMFCPAVYSASAKKKAAGYNQDPKESLETVLFR